MSYGVVEASAVLRAKAHHAERQSRERLARDTTHLAPCDMFQVSAIQELEVERRVVGSAKMFGRDENGPLEDGEV